MWARIGSVILACAACSAAASSIDAGACLLDASDYDVLPDAAVIAPQKMNPPHAPENACTGAQLADYAQCQGEKNQTLCTQFQVGGNGTGCAACMESQSTDPTWGVIIFDQQTQTGSFNIEGCVDLALGQVPIENGTNGSCGDLLHASYQCQDEGNAQLCLGCLGDAGACQETVLATACVAQNNAVLSPTGPCAALFSDAAPQGALDCFPNTKESDPQQQLVDWLTTVGAVFCNP